MMTYHAFVCLACGWVCGNIPIGINLVYCQHWFQRDGEAAINQAA